MDSGMSMGGSGQSMVASCDVTTCTYNQARNCTAGSIMVAFVDGMAHCATYSPEGGAAAMGSSEVPQQIDIDEQA